MRKTYQQPQIEIVDFCVEQGFNASNDGPSFTVYNKEELGDANGDEDNWAN